MESATWRWLGPSEWDRIAGESPTATWFHRRDWAEAICAHDPRYEPRALGLRTARGDWALVPLAARTGRLRRGVAGRAASTQPGTYGGPVVAGRRLDREDWRALRAGLTRVPLGRIDCYDNVLDPLPAEFFADSTEVERRETHVLELAGLPEDPRASYNRGCRNSISKAERARVRVERETGKAAVAEYHALYLETVHRWGKPLERAYRRTLFDDLLAREGAELWLARTEQGRAAAGGVFLFSPRHCVYWHGAMDAELQELRPANLLMHALVCEARARDCELFDFNPSQGLAGVEAFKRSFRAVPRTLRVWRHERPLVVGLKRALRSAKPAPAKGELEDRGLDGRRSARPKARPGPAPAQPRAERAPYRLGEFAVGFRYAELPPGTDERLRLWLEAGEVPAGPGVEVLKAGRVWRIDDWAVKLYPPRGRARDWLRRSPALRASELARLLAVRTPRPLVALERRGARPGLGLGVTEYLAGLPMLAAWDADPRARDTLAGFMAEMHAEGVFHGDLNARNLLWDGAWALLDLEGVRRGLRASLPRRLIDAQWVRVIATLRGREGSRALFEEYLDLVGRSDPDGSRWERIEARARETVRRWDGRRGGPPPDLPEVARWR